MVSVTTILGMFEYPYALFAIIPIMLVLFFLIRKDFVKLVEDALVLKRRKLVQRIMLGTRFVIFMLILIAIASPFIEHEKVIEGDTFLKILIDNSTSMQVLEPFEENIIAELKKKIEVAVLVDRQHKSFPIKVDYKGLSLATTLHENIDVQILGVEEEAVFLN